MTLAFYVNMGRFSYGASPSALASLRCTGLLSSSLLHQLQQTRRTSLLSYEEVSAGSPTSEHPTARPSRTLFVLHGLLGCGRNWRTWARKLVEAAAASNPPEGGPWRALLLDLRCHGASTRRSGLHPPNNMLSAAEDVASLIRHVVGSETPGAVFGHSMGGKVALALLQQAAAARAAATGPAVAAVAQIQPPSPSPPTGQQHLRRRVATESVSSAAAMRTTGSAAGAAVEWCTPPRQLWVLDSQPGLVAAEQDAGTGISRVLNVVHSVPLPIPSRAWLLRHLRDRGLSDALANWLASNLVHVPAPAAAHYQHSASMSSGHSGPSLHSHNHETLHHPYQHHCEDQQQQHRRHGTRIHDGLRPQQQQKGAGSSGLHGGGGSDIGSGSGGPFAWSFDIQCAGAMYMSYRTSEYWQVLEKPPHGTAVHLVQGARSDRWPEAMQRRLNQAAAAAAATGAPPLGSEGGSFDHHVLERAGHWLHVDNPEGLLRLVLPHLAGL
ncbi:hypothetical protein Vafri_6425 [Volvox africanus]|uniref:AB hydrolase-1 domain-containing protein n=1 Tax=Volvox africanus TaxID=51714 RepID=A0A8J4AYG1_9CHLO|nr:hypothetical protein Vafri_6425 [Volvox africanus]